jgi:glutathione S-transferase
MKVYWIRAQAPRRVLALLKYLRVDAELVEVDMMAGGFEDPAYVTLNPNKKAPTLVDGDMVLWESSAIMAHLCIKYNSDLWPAHNPTDQVEVLRWLSWCDQHWSPAVSPFYFEHIVKATFGLGPPNRSGFEARMPDLMRYARVLHEHLDRHTHVACNRLTIADFQLASMATYWREAEMPMGSFRNIVRWLDDLMRLPAWADPWPAGASARP